MALTFVNGIYHPGTSSEGVLEGTAAWRNGSFTVVRSDWGSGNCWARFWWNTLVGLRAFLRRHEDPWTALEHSDAIQAIFEH